MIIICSHTNNNTYNYKRCNHMKIKNDQDLINYFSKTRNLRKNTKKSYTIYIKQYAEFNNMTMVELLNEAEEEEEQGIRWKYRTLKRRLIEYRAYLYDNYAYSSAKSRFGKIKTFYKHFEIEIHDIPKISTINVDKTHMGFKDLPDREIIKKALKISDQVTRAIILFMSSSGCARAETRNLTIQDFIDATNNEFVSYHNSNNIYEVIKELKGRDDIIPVFHLKRQKTNKAYYTFCSPESVAEIISYLASRTKKFASDDPLFDVGFTKFNEGFQRVNDKLGLGRLENGRRRFTSHMLRKFHSTTLWNEKVPKEVVDALQGRGKDQIHSSYFYENPLKLLEIYIENMQHITINWDVSNVTIKSKEYLELEKKYEEKEREVQEINSRMDNIEKKLFEIDSRKNILDKISEK